MRSLRAIAALALAAVLFVPGADAQAGASAPPAGGLGPAPRSATLEVALPLAINDAGLQAFADAVSTPSSPQYGRFASLAQLDARFGARPGAASAVIAFLRAHGARDASFDPAGQFVDGTLTVAEAQRAFGVALLSYRGSAGEEYIAPSAGVARAASALPGALHGLVTGVVGLDTEPLVQPSMHAALTNLPAARAAAGQTPSAYFPDTGTAAGCRGARRTRSFTPRQYLTAYGIRALHNQGLQGQGIKVALIEIDGFRGSDIARFTSCFRLPYPHVYVHPVGGLRHPLAPGGESTLDIELLSAAAPRLSAIDVYESAGSAGHVLHAYSAALGRHPQVISASLGICEQLAYADMGRPGINAIERILHTAAAMGVSVLASAGDQGSSACVKHGRILDELAVSYPASSPYVTAVGGTNFILSRANTIQDEFVWNDTSIIPDAGGGGLSQLFKRPRFQNGVTSLPVRVVPDVSMMADLAPGYAIYCTVHGAACGNHPGWVGAGGTSAAAPLLAGGLALVDQDLRRHHRHVLGDVNPLLYLLGASGLRVFIFRDITVIGNDLGPYLPHGNGQGLGCCSAGPGYDAASGWGSVNLYGLAHAVAPPTPKHKKHKKKKKKKKKG